MGKLPLFNVPHGDSSIPTAYHLIGGLGRNTNHHFYSLCIKFVSRMEDTQEDLYMQTVCSEHGCTQLAEYLA